MCEDVDLSDEKIKRQLLNGFWVESSGSQELEKSKCLDIVASVAVNFVKVCARESGPPLSWQCGWKNEDATVLMVPKSGGITTTGTYADARRLWGIE